MTRHQLRLRALWLTSALTIAAVNSASAQSTPPAAPPASGDANKQEETLVLSPFVVTADEDVGYTANSTLAGTRVRTELKDVASAISVVTSQFLQDTGSKNQQDLLVYTTNTEVAGVRGNFSAAGGAATYNENGNLLRPSNNTRVRGLDAADNTRDYFLTEIPWDGYIVDRVDLQRGPNSILFGVGSPAGIINTSINTATFKNQNKIENRIGRYGSFRTSGDFNYVAKKNVLSFRAAFLDDETKYQQKPAFNHDKRLFAAMRYEPKLFGENAHTTIRANYENGNVNANRPRMLPPIDAITPWFLSGNTGTVPNPNKLTLNPLTTADQYGKWNGTQNQYPWFREAFMGRMFSSNVAGFFDAGNGGLFNLQPNYGTLAFGRDGSGAVDGTIDGIPFARPWAITTFNNFARVGIPGGKYYSNYSLSDTSIFDFFNNLIDGNNKREWQDWNAANLAISQTFFNDRLGFEFVYDYQRYKDGQLSFLQGDQFALSVDINTHLIDGTPNPNVGRPYVGNSGQYGNAENYIDRDAKRLTAFADLNSEDYLGKTWVSKLLGRHVFTGLWSKDTKETDARSFQRWALDPAFNTARGVDAKITSGTRAYDWLAYLGPSLLSKSSAAGANLSPVTTVIDPNGDITARYFDSHWNSNVAFGAPYTYTTYDANGNPVTNTKTQSENPANYIGWKSGSVKVLNYSNPADRAALYSSTQLQNIETESKAFIWQAYLWDGTIVPTFGWRRDEIVNETRAGFVDPADSTAVSSTDYSKSTPKTTSAAGESKSWGVVLHTPPGLRAKLPFGSNLSVFANKSENFKADAPRGDIFGNAIDNPKAETKDYGIVISTLDDRLTFKITKYETKMKNATLQADSAGFSNNLYYAWALPYWGATHALAALDGIADPQLRQGNWGWPWNNIAGGDPVRIQAVVNDFFKNFPLTQTFADEYGLGLNVAAMHAATTNAQRYASVPTYGLNAAGVYDTSAGKGAGDGLGLQPAYSGRLKSFGSGPVASVDTTSSGMEYEITAQPTKNWSVSVNFSKTKAVRDAISPTIEAWINSYTQFLAGDAGLITLWGGDTFRKNWENNILAPYAVLKAQIGSQVPEVAPWRFNAVTNYNFKEGWLKDVNAGLAYRWEDKRILGYKYDATKDVLDIDQPLYGPTDDHFDAWVGYGRKIAPKVYWRIQLNLRNVGEKTHLVPVNIQPDGSIALSRIQEGLGWQITNTFSF